MQDSLNSVTLSFKCSPSFSICTSSFKQHKHKIATLLEKQNQRVSDAEIPLNGSDQSLQSNQL